MWATEHHSGKIQWYITQQYGYSTGFTVWAVMISSKRNYAKGSVVTVQDFSWRSPKGSPNLSSLQARLGRIVQSAREWEGKHRAHTFPTALDCTHRCLLAHCYPGHIPPLEIHVVTCFQRVWTGCPGEWVDTISILAAYFFISKPSSERHSLAQSKVHSFCTSSSSCPFRSRESSMQ